MTNIGDVISLSTQVKDIVYCCKSIYGDKWDEIRTKYRKIIEKHHIENKTTNLLASAAKLSEGEDERVVLVLIGSAVD